MQYNHSLIDKFPIDYDRFPLAIDYKYVEIILNPHDYLVIPKYWSHWVFSEPYTFAVSYSINMNNMYLNENIRYNKCKNENINNVIFNNLINNSAHTGTYISNYKFNYKQFIFNSINFNFNFKCSNTSDVCPVNKPSNNCNKYGFNANLNDVLNDSYFMDKYLYIGQQSTINFDKQIDNPNANILTIPNFDNIVNEVSFSYIPRLWFNFDKPIDSGLHFDDTDSILYVLSGRKKVLLSHHSYNSYIYIKDMPVIKNINYIPKN